MADDRCENLLRISAEAFERFRRWHQLNQDIAENFYPMRADFTRSLDFEEFAGNVMDGTGINARETLGNSIDAMLRQKQWFHMGTGDSVRDKRPGNMVSLRRATSALYNTIYHPQSGLIGTLKETDMDWVSFGAFVMSIEASENLMHLVFKPWHLRDCAWMLNEDGIVDTMFRRMRMSARDIMRRFRSGRWKGTHAPAIADAERLSPSKEFTILHVLMPTDDVYASSAADMRRIRHPYISIYIDVENRTYLHEAGAPVFNYVVGRNRTLSGLPFGFSPMALNSLADSRMLQDMALVILEQGQKAVDPPTIGAAQVFTRDMNYFAGGHTEVDLEPDQDIRKAFTTIEAGQIGVGLELKMDVRNLIAEAWLLNKLTLPSVREMRELEVQVRTDEYRRAALPFYQPIDSNYHGEVLGTSFEMATHIRLLPADMFGPDLRGKGVDFTFESPLNEAEGMEVVRQYYEAINITAAGAEIDPTVKSILDLRQAAEDALARGTRPEWLIPEDQREEADKQADALGGLTSAAQIAREGAGVMADLSNAQIAAQQAGLAA